MRISAILSDYDGTLCPTISIRSDENIIPEELENILWNISEQIPACIISSKDFGFLHNKTRFASVVSCILGIETLVLKRHKRTMLLQRHSKEYVSDWVANCHDFMYVENSHPSVNDITLQHNSKLLSQIAEEIASSFMDISIELKFTSLPKKSLAGITIDWRHVDDWKSFKLRSEPQLIEIINEMQRKLQQQNGPTIQIQTYATHPFIDIYAAKCNKGIAYDTVLSELHILGSAIQKVVYLGDSENDNPAFRKADVSIGVKSDERLSPNLECKYTMKFDKVAGFLEKLQNDNFEFCDVLQAVDSSILVATK
jgi:HAD superfamily hydrolase (TIGR01484 family)